jgi:hypothetical protein
VDDPAVAEALSATFAAEGSRIEVWLDLDCGMHRTGMAPGPEAVQFYRRLESLPGLITAGLHAYGGHVHESDPRGRAEQCDAAFAPVTALRTELERETRGPVRIIADGAPTFSIQARRGDVECSPGTCLLWDFGYADRFPDLEFLQAALVLTRVVSKPGPDRLCLDLGHKAIAAENPQPRVRFPELPDAEALMHSEEHLVIRSSTAAELRSGTCCLASRGTSVPRWPCMRRRWSSGAVARWTAGKSPPAIVGSRSEPAMSEPMAVATILGLSAGTASFEPNSLSRCGNAQPCHRAESPRRFPDVPISCRTCDMKWGRGRLDVWDGHMPAAIKR